MKVNAFILIALFIKIISCNNAGKDSVEKADSANNAHIDSALTHNTTVLDEESSSFLVKATDNCMAEIQLASMAQQKALSKQVRDFSSMLVHDNSVLNDQVKSLGAQLSVILPGTISSDKQKQINDLSKKKDLKFDNAYIENVIKNYTESISLYEKALMNKKDPDINSYADKTLMTLRMHLDSAKNIRSSIK